LNDVAEAKMLRWFESLYNPVPDGTVERPPTGLLGFYWYFIRQFKLGFLAILIVGTGAALVEVALFAFVGELVDLLQAVEGFDQLWAEHGDTLIMMALVALIARPLLFGLHATLINQAVAPNINARVRWQTHRYVLRQSMGFFQNDFAGRVANRVMQTAASVRESALEVVNALWFVFVYATSTLVLFFEIDPPLVIPLLIWIALYCCILWYFVPRIRARSKIQSEARSSLMGRIVDSYTNMATVKLFSHTDREDAYARDGIVEHTEKLQHQMWAITGMQAWLWSINGILIVGTAGLALWLWGTGGITLGAIALATGLVIRINNLSGWIMWVVTGIFEAIGTVQDGMTSIVKPLGVVDAPEARPLRVERGEIRYDRIRFHYGKEGGIIDDLSLTIRPGEKVGLVGRSGAGKSTLVNLLLRFHDLEGGRILIDGQEIGLVTQDSLRAQIGMVSQDTSLLHRSIADNIGYGQLAADHDSIVAAATQAQAAGFIPALEDAKGQTGYAAEVGERGVKLSGGQRQRIAIARVLLKNAPILVLDEATSALDSEVEAEIQQQLYALMAGKTVIAIAHRLSTIAAMDRLVVMDAGRIVEDGSHDVLLRQGGLYAQLWARQSGGFIARDSAA
jgi:ATP-binding cassette, subfamily B, multidrug efflux pump